MKTDYNLNHIEGTSALVSAPRAPTTGGISRVHFSSGNDEWETPPWLYDRLNGEFHFTLDACALPETAKCPRYFTPEDDGLSKPWVEQGGGAVFCNPPYSRRTKDKPGQEAWIRKAHEEGSKPGAVVVMLIPARTDTEAFHKYIYNQAEIRFIKGRVRFLTNGQPASAAPFPSMVVIFRGPALQEEYQKTNQD